MTDNPRNPLDHDAMELLAVCVRSELTGIAFEEPCCAWTFAKGRYGWAWVTDTGDHLWGEGDTLPEAIIAATANLREWEAEEQAEVAAEEAQEATQRAELVSG